MSFDMAIRFVSLCGLLAGVETLHGMARTVLLVPRVGKARAQKWGIVCGSGLAFAVCYVGVPGMGLAGVKEHLVLGAGLAAFMAAFDLALSRWLLGRPWSQALRDFNPATGNYLVFGLGLLTVFPAVVAWLRTTNGGI